MLDKTDFAHVLRDRPQFVKSIVDTAQARYNVYADQFLSQQD
jgi:hypothetical protein